MTTPPNTQDNGPLDNPTGLFAERLAALRQLAPELFAGSRDGVPTVAAIQAFLGEDENAAKGEAFEFSWVGKAEAKRGAGLPPTGTLIPEPNRTEPNRTEPNRTEPNRTEPNRTEPNRTEPNRTW